MIAWCTIHSVRSALLSVPGVRAAVGSSRRTSLNSTALMYRSSVSPVSLGVSQMFRSGASAFITVTGDETTRSGSPIVHSVASFQTNGGGMSAGFPRGAPRSTHSPIKAIWSSLSEISSLNR